MPRTARLVVPGYPHHITQRGIRGHRTFFNTTDYLFYVELLKEFVPKYGVGIWAYCLMPNHVHLVAVPRAENGLAKLFGQVHSRYARQLNARHGWSGHLWQGRFYSVVMDEPHTIAAMRYVELNPVRARICAQPEEWRWSSVHEHLGTRDGDFVDVDKTREIIGDWQSYLGTECSAAMQDSLRKHTRTGRPAGTDDFVDALEKETGKRIHRRKPGPHRG